MTTTDLFETRNRLHIYSRAYCTLCGPRYEPLSRTPFTSRGINLIHMPSFEFAYCRSDLFKASWISRLARKEKLGLHRRQLCRRHDRHWRRVGADVVGVIPLLPRHNGPQYSGILIGQSDHSFLPSSSLTELLNPQEDRVVILASECNRLGTLNEQGTQIMLPRLVILPKLLLPPLEFCFGVKPSHAANCAPFLNCLKSPTVATTADAVIDPTPINSAARWTCASVFW